jgi:putative membrane protein
MLFVFCGLFAFFAEVIGVKYGIIFGNYYYGEALGYKILSVPVIIIINWMIILAGSISVSEIISKNKIVIIFLSAFFAIIFDYLMEPVAMYFNYWSWANGTIPFINYLTWGILIFIFACIYVFNGFSMKFTMPAFLFVIQIAYFLLLKLAIYSGIIH